MLRLKADELLYQEVDPEGDAQVSLRNKLGRRRRRNYRSRAEATAGGAIALAAIASAVGPHFDFQDFAVIGLFHGGEGLAAAGADPLLFWQVNDFVRRRQMFMVAPQRTGVARLLPAATLAFGLGRMVWPFDP